MRSSGPKNFIPNARRATALVEMSLALLLLLLLTMGVIEYGWLMLKQQQIMNAARQAARIASTADATTGTVNSQISTLMTSYRIDPTWYTVTISPSDVSTAARGSSVSVSISVDYTKLSIMGPRSTLVPRPSTLSATVAMEKEGP